MCLVSIIVPVYNVEKYLEKCLDSIINQTYKDIEIILIDDGSKDNSGEICDVYAKRDNRILVIHKKNTGVSDTRNKGIKVANGKYICFIDSDDSVTLNYVEKLVRPTRNEDYDLVICNFQKLFPDKVLDMSFSNIKCFSGIFLQDYQFLYTITSFPCGKLYKASLIKEKNIIFPVDFTDAEDQMFNFQYYCYVKKYYLINEPLYYYWQRSGSASKNNSLESFKCNLLKLKCEKNFYRNNHVENYDNLIVLKTCSKAFGMAAIRLGIAVTNEKLTGILHAIKAPYNVNSVTQAIGCVLFSHPEYLASCIDALKASRDELYQAVKAMEDKKTEIETVYETSTNFIFMKVKRAKEVFEALTQRGISIRFMNGYLRVTAGTKAENKEVMEALWELIQ